MTGERPDVEASGLGMDSLAWRIVQEWARGGTVPTAKLGEVLRRYAEVLDGPDPRVASALRLADDAERGGQGIVITPGWTTYYAVETNLLRAALSPSEGQEQ